VIAAYAPSLQMRVKRWPDAPGARFHLAIAVLRELARAQAGTAHGLSSDELSSALRTDPLQIEPILDDLVALDWVGRLDESGSPRFVLLCDVATTPAQPLLGALLLEATPAVRGFWQRAGFDQMRLHDLLHG
jgi:membrane protein